MASGLYRAPGICPANEKLVAEISDELDLQIPESEIKDYTDLINEVLSTANVINDIPQPKPEVAYPRTPGYRPEAKDNPYNAWYMKTEIEGASAGLLAGKRIAIKDNVAVAGVPMMNGSSMVEGRVPEYDATVVTRILKAGGTIAGKSVCENLCFSGSSFTTASGPVLNPADKTRTTGGSSSGSAALVAAGEVEMAIGGDQGGSIRVPASWCGIVGLKPTFSLVPYAGAIGFFPNIDHLGPMTRTVIDCATLLQAIAGPDPFDSRQSPLLEVPDYLEGLERDVAGMKVGLLAEGFALCTEEEVKTTVKSAAEKLNGVGCTVGEVSVPYHHLGRVLFPHILFPALSEAMKNGGVLPGTGGWHDVAFAKRFKEAVQLHSKDLSPTSKMMMATAGALKRHDGYNTFAKAENLVPVLRKAYDDVLKEYVIIMPTAPFVAPKQPTEGPLPIKEYKEQSRNMTVNTAPFNLTGHPALSINAGFTKEDKLPIGMMIVGRHFDDAKVLRVARAFEKVRDN